MQSVNNHVVPFLPFPGQIIQPSMPNDTAERPWGTLCLYMRLKNADGSPHGGVFALASRHVTIGDIFDHHRDYGSVKHASLISGTHHARSATESNPRDILPIPVSWGSDLELERKMRTLKDFVRELILWPVQKQFSNGTLPENEVPQLQIAENCVSIYVPSLLQEMAQHSAAAEDGGQGSAGRKFGQVALSSRHDHNRFNGWRDWSLVALDDGNRPSLEPFSPSQGLPPPPPCPSFETNNVYVGNTLADERLEKHEGWPDDAFRALQALLINMDTAGFVRLQPRTGGDPASTLSQAKEQKFVFKRGATTGVTMGRTSPIEAVVRMPLPNKDIVSWAIPVLGMPTGQSSMPNRQNPFTSGGDSGSCIFDQTGTVLAMVDAGIGSRDDQRQLLVAHGKKRVGDPPVPLPKDRTIPPQPREPVYAGPSQFEPWVRAVHRKEEFSYEQVDITLATPFEWITEDICDVTGLRAHLL
ncbi:hypothetical protein SPBR_01696 [Sporothrix brasiliensis 5110]|uniref:Uncharacterized protein n=1 Tax=Sporothrix brasiliensis 5110 TaxID=1398154 RepID=A0A0C2EXJ6_9PEZI|nr:uncharacterized protein SPBR_01696 [Sporothrix brasiliensis 5110]KIH91339.1 hypothetical protein SPBR_01696 [Sporothrix brasiliensis 5110]